MSITVCINDFLINPSKLCLQQNTKNSRNYKIGVASSQMTCLIYLSFTQSEIDKSDIADLKTKCWLVERLMVVLINKVMSSLSVPTEQSIL